MDVMGGIADYSGSLVLQMPIAEACHVALQRQGPGMGAVAQCKDSAVVSVVSFHAEPDHRSPTFSAPLSDLFPRGGDAPPLEYPQARAYFKANASTSWAGCAYVDPVNDLNL